METAEGGGSDRLERCFANVPDEQAAALIAIESPSSRGKSTCKEPWTRGFPSQHAQIQTTGDAVGVGNIPSSYRARRRHTANFLEGEPV